MLACVTPPLRTRLSLSQVLAFLNLSAAWTTGDLSATGLAWERIGLTPPSAPLYGKTPRQLHHPKLSAILAKKLKRAHDGAQGAEGAKEAKRAEGKAEGKGEAKVEEGKGEVKGEAKAEEGKGEAKAKAEEVVEVPGNPSRLELSEDEWKACKVSAPMSDDR